MLLQHLTRQHINQQIKQTKNDGNFLFRFTLFNKQITNQKQNNTLVNKQNTTEND